ncbi:sporulation protein YunB [Clostridium sp. MD294]|uniref:sporulation protein YunB n=1 Tax=Clostridium sp. MD294 TaxID=97138 RepID=UPI0002CA84A0|nr:sporulation protein YunB [Clostridium sp. MD294]NDO45391.1 sporulation protein YunB [Clostridium sp. MD294]USF30965.1 Sporulation protein YunB [Clostridium sp. MD294]
MKKNKRVHRFMKLFLLFLVLTSIIFTILILYDTKIFKTVVEISHIQSKSTANTIIDKAVQNTIKELNITSSDFFIEKQQDNTAVSVNTILINTFCSSVSIAITQGMEKIAEEHISIPIGVITGIEMFSNVGPNIPFYIKPMGIASVDYETSFSAEGINQTNFKIWLNVRMDIRIVNPLRSETMSVSRKIMLVDTIINGTVPERYMTLGN